MRRSWVVVVLALLAVSAQPVAAASVGVVASKHTDFGTGSETTPTLTRMDIEGSGDSAAVSYESGLVDSFEDGDQDEYNGVFFGGNVTGERASHGQYSFKTNATGYHGIRSTGGLPITPSQGETVTGDVLITGDGDNGFWLGVGTNTTRGGYYSARATENGSLRIVKENSSGLTTLSTTPLGALPENEWIDVRVKWTHTGQITATINATNVSVSTTATDTQYTAGGIHLFGDQADGPDNQTAAVYWDNIRVNTQPGHYYGAVHDNSNISAAFANLTTVRNTSATLLWQEDADNDNVWTNVTSQTVTSPGNYTADLSGTTSDRWRLRVDTAASEPAARVVLADEGVTFDPRPPTLSNPDPSGPQSTYHSDVSIDVADREFGTAYGDSVTVTAVNGSGIQVGQTTITSNQTVSFQYDALAGTNTINWTATDSYGHTETVTQTFDTPDQLTIYREATSSTKIASATVTLRFYPVGNQSAKVVTKTTSNGTINMTGLPVNQPLVAVANASGYESRRVFIRSLYAQQRMYLLNSSADSVETIFEMRDYSGRYPPDNTVLEIQRSINGDWQTISGDYFGATAQYPATLETGARYRLRLYNPETGATRLLGTYQPIAAQTQTIEVSPQSGLSDRGALPSASVRPQTRQIPARNNTELSVALSAGRNTTVDSWRVIVERNGTTITNTTYAGRTRETTLTTDLANASGTQVNVTVETTLDDGQTVTAGVAALQVYDSPANQLSLLALLAEFVGLAAPGTAAVLTSFVASAATVFVMAGVSTQLPVSGETTALAGVLTLTGFAVIGWVGYDVVFVAGAAVVAFAALRRGL